MLSSFVKDAHNGFAESGARRLRVTFPPDMLHAAFDVVQVTTSNVIAQDQSVVGFGRES